MLALDSRNFHCWNYRRVVASLFETVWCESSVDRDQITRDEWNFSTDKIKENFSNYSAWHYRSTLVPKFIQPNQHSFHTFVRQEFALIKDAIFTEPADQSIWLYHRWLLGQVLSGGSVLSLGISLGLPSCSGPVAIPHNDQVALLRQEIDTCKLLLAEEPNCKWVLITSAILHASLHDLLTNPSTTNATLVSEMDAESLRSMFVKLLSLDGMRKNYYLSIEQHITDHSATRKK